jgi:hypothetical protein
MRFEERIEERETVEVLSKFVCIVLIEERPLWRVG